MVCFFIYDFQVSILGIFVFKFNTFSTFAVLHNSPSFAPTKSLGNSFLKKVHYFCHLKKRQAMQPFHFCFWFFELSYICVHWFANKLKKWLTQSPKWQIYAFSYDGPMFSTVKTTSRVDDWESWFMWCLFQLKVVQ